MSYADFSDTSLEDVGFSAVNPTGGDFQNAELWKSNLMAQHIQRRLHSNVQSTSDCSSYINMNSAHATNTDFSNLKF